MKKLLIILKTIKPTRQLRSLKKAIDVNDLCARAYKLLFEINISTNKLLAFDYFEKLIKVNSSFLIISSNEILKLSSTYQDQALDKKIYEIIMNHSKPNLFSPNLYEFMFNFNNYETPQIMCLK